MARLYRPSIPVEVKCKVLLRQIGELWPDEALATAKKARQLTRYVEGLKTMLAQTLNCAAADLRLDHNPALENRPQFRRGLGKKTYYVPDANDPDHLIYREKHDHHIKTNVRGEHGQYPDNTLAKRERRRLKKKTPPPNAKIAKTWNLHPCMSCGRVHAKGKCRALKRKMPSRPFQNRRKKR